MDGLGLCIKKIPEDTPCAGTSSQPDPPLVKTLQVDLCRLCANVPDSPIEIYNAEGITPQLSEIINEYLPVKVSPEDELSLCCCSNCASTILSFHEFALSCVEAQKRLPVAISEEPKPIPIVIPPAEPDQQMATVDDEEGQLMDDDEFNEMNEDDESEEETKLLVPGTSDDTEFLTIEEAVILKPELDVVAEDPDYFTLEEDCAPGKQDKKCCQSAVNPGLISIEKNKCIILNSVLTKTLFLKQEECKKRNESEIINITNDEDVVIVSSRDKNEVNDSINKKRIVLDKGGFNNNKKREYRVSNCVAFDELKKSQFDVRREGVVKSGRTVGRNASLCETRVNAKNNCGNAISKQTVLDQFGFKVDYNKRKSDEERCSKSSQVEKLIQEELLKSPTQSMGLGKCKNISGANVKCNNNKSDGNDIRQDKHGGSRKHDKQKGSLKQNQSVDKLEDSIQHDNQKSSLKQNQFVEKLIQQKSLLKQNQSADELEVGIQQGKEKNSLKQNQFVNKLRDSTGKKKSSLKQNQSVDKLGDSTQHDKQKQKQFVDELEEKSIKSLKENQFADKLRDSIQYDKKKSSLKQNQSMDERGNNIDYDKQKSSLKQIQSVDNKRIFVAKQCSVQIDKISLDELFLEKSKLNESKSSETDLKKLPLIDCDLKEIRYEFKSVEEKNCVLKSTWDNIKQNIIRNETTHFKCKLCRSKVVNKCNLQRHVRMFHLSNDDIIFKKVISFKKNETEYEEAVDGLSKEKTYVIKIDVNEEIKAEIKEHWTEIRDHVFSTIEKTENTEFYFQCNLCLNKILNRENLKRHFLNFHLSAASGVILMSVTYNNQKNNSNKKLLKTNNEQPTNSKSSEAEEIPTVNKKSLKRKRSESLGIKVSVNKTMSKEEAITKNWESIIDKVMKTETVKGIVPTTLYKCTMCKSVIQNRKNTLRHFKTFHLCDKRVKWTEFDEDCEDQEIRKRCQIGSQLFKCDICAQIQTSFACFMKHYRDHQSEQKDDKQKLLPEKILEDDIQEKSLPDCKVSDINCLNSEGAEGAIGENLETVTKNLDKIISIKNLESTKESEIITIEEDVNEEITIDEDVNEITNINKDVKKTIDKNLNKKTTIDKDVNKIITIDKDVNKKTIIDKDVNKIKTIDKDVNKKTTIDKDVNKITTNDDDVNEITTVDEDVNEEISIFEEIILKSSVEEDKDEMKKDLKCHTETKKLRCKIIRDFNEDEDLISDEIEEIRKDGKVFYQCKLCGVVLLGSHNRNEHIRSHYALMKIE